MSAQVETYGPGNPDYDRHMLMLKMDKGVVVKFKNNPKAPAGTLLVVVNQSAKGVSLFRLGGSPDGRYWRGVDPRHLEVVDIDALIAK